MQILLLNINCKENESVEKNDRLKNFFVAGTKMFLKQKAIKNTSYSLY
jgi:hypothetical protein